MDYKKISEQLLSMVTADQQMRKSFQEKLSDWDEEIDNRNTKELKEIVDSIGWPRISQVGPEASRAAWLLVQHSPDREFQNECLRLMKNLPKDEIEQKYIAYLEDRVLIARGDKQIYGTQFRKNDGGEFGPLPIEDPENVNIRRKEVGLNTIEEYAEGFGK